MLFIWVLLVGLLRLYSSARCLKPSLSKVTLFISILMNELRVLRDHTWGCTWSLLTSFLFLYQCCQCQDGSGLCLNDKMWFLLEISGIFLFPMILFFQMVHHELAFCSLETSWSSWLADQVTHQNFRVLRGVSPNIFWILTEFRGQGPNIGCFFHDLFTSLILASKFFYFFKFLNIYQGCFTRLKDGVTGYIFNISNSTVTNSFPLTGSVLVVEVLHLVCPL